MNETEFDAIPLSVMVHNKLNDSGIHKIIDLTSLTKKEALKKLGGRVIRQLAEVGCVNYMPENETVAGKRIVNSRSETAVDAAWERNR